MGTSRASKNVIYRALGKTKYVAGVAGQKTKRAIKLAGEVAKAFGRNAIGRDARAILGKKK